MVRPHRTIVLMTTIALLTSACGSGSGSGSSPSSASAAGENSEVPDVEGMELRGAVEKIEAEGFVAELSTELGPAKYVATLEEYLQDGSMQITPQAVVDATDPESGSEAEEGSRVVITRLECPDDLRECD